MTTPDTPAHSTPSGLADAEYLRLAHAALAAIETTIDRWLDEDLIDIDTHRTGGLLELSLPGPGGGSKIILNTQPPLHEIWLAARAGGHHYRYVDGLWRDTRDGTEFFIALSQHASAQTGQVLRFEPPVT